MPPELKIPTGPAIGAFMPRPDPSTQPLPAAVSRITSSTQPLSTETEVVASKAKRTMSRPKVTAASDVVTRKSTITVPVVPALHQRVRLYANLLGVDIQDMITTHLNEWIPTLAELAKMTAEAAAEE